MSGAFRWCGPDYTAARGRVNIGFADGHVRMFAVGELVDVNTGRSRFNALWTSLDPQVERAAYVNYPVEP
jgi:prepilin-type processing-associated H-X9-DG protein